ncbi:site-specific integrase [Buttiauxella sp. WJP83]|uniref:tyrosine-type recombinase/integrase n=1 Tax=Buttiauxella sp. WJP83 TaxID=2986951 RepID=UPI0022DE80BB|nr:site-specific integrase [Buttiauxella sp. WJP83]WBM71921.1 site-specific integrase [Buttiauxella sp. WJP83]
MATFRTLPSGKVQCQIRKAGQKPISSTHPTLEDAEQWAREQEQEQSPANTIQLLAPLYLSEVMIKAGKKRGGYDSVENRLTVVARNLRTTALEAITKEDVVAYRSHRLNAVTGSTVRLEIQLLSRFLRWAKEEHNVACEDVTQGVKLPEAGKARDVIVEPDELRRILKWASEKSKPIIELAYETAMRRNEILAITPYMIDLDKRIIRLMGDLTKNGEARKVPLTLRAMEILKEQCKGKQVHQRIFDISPYGITQAFRRAARIAEVENVCFHSLRHTAITNAAEKGLSTVQLMAVSGHKTLSMLSRYAHVKAESIAHLLD